MTEQTTEEIRQAVAEEHGLGAHAARLRGETREELTADAREFLASIDALGQARETVPDFDGGVRQSATDGPDMNSLLRKATGRRP